MSANVTHYRVLTILMDIIANQNGFAVYIKSDSEHLHAVPSPSYCWLVSGSGGFILAYEIAGEVSTFKAEQFLTDIIARFCLTYGVQVADIPIFEPIACSRKQYELKELESGLKSLKRRVSTFSKGNQLNVDDRLFGIAQEWCQLKMREDEPFSESDIASIIRQAGGTESECRCKSKSMYSYYRKNNFQPSKRVHTMTREESAKNARNILQAKTKSKIESAVNSLIFFGTKITAVEVAKITGISRQTCSKYIKQMKADGFI